MAQRGDAGEREGRPPGGHDEGYAAFDLEDAILVWLLELLMRGSREPRRPGS